MLRRLKLLVSALALVGVLGVSLGSAAQTVTNSNFDLTCDTSVLDYDARYLDYPNIYPDPEHRGAYIQSAKMARNRHRVQKKVQILRVYMASAIFARGRQLCQRRA